MKYVISGASAVLGRLVADELLTHIPAADLTLISRHTEALAKYSALGVNIFHGQHGDKSSLDAGYAGADRLFMISSLSIGKRGAEHANAISAAKAAGIQHITYTSVAGAHPENPTPSANDHVVTERLLWESGISFASLRNQMYAELLYNMVNDMAIPTGKWVHNSAIGKFSPVSRKDIAASVTAIMLSPQKHDRVVYEITGPERITFPALAKLAEKLWQKPIEYIPVTDEQMYGIFDQLGIPRLGIPTAKEIPLLFGSHELVQQFSAYEMGLLDVLSGHVEFITGKKPRTIEAVLTELIAANA